MNGAATIGGPVLIMAGGTGGHVFPALAVAKVLRDRGVAVVWLGVPGSMESRLVPANGFPIEWVRVAGIRGKGLKAWLLAPLRIVKAVAQSWLVLRRVRPRSVLGAGGYVSGPGGIAAWLLRVPLLIHEQNAIAGFTNRCLSHLAREVLEAFPGSFGRDVKARAIGNPVRSDISAVAPPAERFAARSGVIRILVIGGSLGAAPSRFGGGSRGSGARALRVPGPLRLAQPALLGSRFRLVLGQLPLRLGEDPRLFQLAAIVLLSAAASSRTFPQWP